MKAPAFAYVRARSLEHAFDLLERHGDAAKLLAGGQSLIPALNMRLAAPELLIDITSIPGLDEIGALGADLRIGALATHRSVEESPLVRAHAPLVTAALEHVAHPAIRAVGTFGGTMAHADPSAELPACALALDMRFIIAGRSGTRTVPASAFFTGLYEADIGPAEILIAGDIPPLGPNDRTAFFELSRRHGDYAIVGVAAVAKMQGGRFDDVRLAYFGVGGTPILARAAGARLAGSSGDRDAAAAAVAALCEDLDPFEDHQGSADLRMHLAGVLLGRVVSRLREEN